MFKEYIKKSLLLAKELSFLCFATMGLIVKAVFKRITIIAFHLVALIVDAALFVLNFASGILNPLMIIICSPMLALASSHSSNFSKFYNQFLDFTSDWISTSRSKMTQLA